jgi:hypothetical protein
MDGYILRGKFVEEVRSKFIILYQLIFRGKSLDGATLTSSKMKRGMVRNSGGIREEQM